MTDVLGLGALVLAGIAVAIVLARRLARRRVARLVKAHEDSPDGDARMRECEEQYDAGLQRRVLR